MNRYLTDKASRYSFFFVFLSNSDSPMLIILILHCSNIWVIETRPRLLESGCYFILNTDTGRETRPVCRSLMHNSGVPSCCNFPKFGTQVIFYDQGLVIRTKSRVIHPSTPLSISSHSPPYNHTCDLHVSDPFCQHSIHPIILNTSSGPRGGSKPIPTRPLLYRLVILRLRVFLAT